MVSVYCVGFDPDRNIAVFGNPRGLLADQRPHPVEGIEGARGVELDFAEGISRYAAEDGIQAYDTRPDARARDGGDGGLGNEPPCEDYRCSGEWAAQSQPVNQLPREHREALALAGGTEA